MKRTDRKVGYFSFQPGVKGHLKRLSMRTRLSMTRILELLIMGHEVPDIEVLVRQLTEGGGK